MEEVAELLVETQTGVLLIPTPSLLGVGTIFMEAITLVYISSEHKVSKHPLVLEGVFRIAV